MAIKLSMPERSDSTRRNQARETQPDLTPLFQHLNHSFFAGSIPDIPVEWSRRLTRAAGLFWWKSAPGKPIQAGIRLSTPLLAERSLSDLQSILAHECIHAWIALCHHQPRHGHGPLFRTQLARINRKAEGFQVTLHHSFTEEVQQLAKYCWECTGCGQHFYRRRNSIDPARHRCGKCRSQLRSRPLPL